MMKHFIFGYGSLICPQSRAITAPSIKDAIAEPVLINGIERTWSARVTKRQARSSTGEGGPTEPESNIPGHILGWTPVGVRFGRGARCNGVLIHVDEEELMRFDVREAGYLRRRIELADVHRHVDSDKLIEANMPLWPTGSAENFDEGDDGGDISSSLMEQLGDVKCPECRLVFEKASEERRTSGSERTGGGSSSGNEDIAVWVYVQTENLPAERSFPISQSYVDIIVRGCLSISHDFACRFLETTHGWWHGGFHSDHEKSTGQAVEDSMPNLNIGGDEEHSVEKHHTWVNDRHAPMYVRADKQYSLKNGEEIDELIKKHRPHALQRRVTLMEF